MLAACANRFQNADLYSTLGVVAATVISIAWPAQRRRGWYLTPAVAADLAEAPALIHPLLLVVYVWLFDSVAWRKNLERHAAGRSR
jgi:hypothetical protein